MTMTAFLARSQVPAQWHLVDCKDQILGRISSKIASILMGKNKAEFSPHDDCGDHVVVINAKNVKLTGKKAMTKAYFSHSTYAGGGKLRTFEEYQKKDPTFPLINAVKGMLPKTALGKKMISKLHVYADGNHPHGAQSPADL